MEKSRKKNWYWVAKVFIIVFMLFTAYMSFINKEAFHDMGFPDYLRIQITVAKLLGVVALLVPGIPLRLKEWVYAGFVITMVSALIAHIVHKDPLSTILFVSVDLTLYLTCVWYVSKQEWKLERAISLKNYQDTTTKG